jgi:two-component system, NtrC family, sensor kinase
MSDKTVRNVEDGASGGARNPAAAASELAAARSPFEVLRTKVLVVDDEKSIRTTLAAFLQAQGHEVATAADGDEARMRLAAGRWDVVVTDVVLPGISGVELLKAIRAAAPAVQVIVMTGEPTVETASEAVRAGAVDYLVKPIPRAAIVKAVENASRVRAIILEKERLERENLRYQGGLQALVEERTRQLAQSEARLQVILEKLPIGVAIIGRDKVIRWANPTAMRMAEALGPAELVGKLCTDALCPVKPDACPVFDEGRILDHEERLLQTRSGKKIPVLKSAVEIDLHGESVLLETFLDITERKRIDAQFLHTQKLESIGQLAAGIAHEINTPMQFIGDSVHFLKGAFDDLSGLLAAYRAAIDERARGAGGEAVAEGVRAAESAADMEYLAKHVPRAFERCADGVGRVSTIVGAMKEFAHPDVRQKCPADINKALMDTLTICRNEYKYVADVETDLAAIPPVDCHIGELNQVFLNLIVNAAHAIADVVGTGGQKGRIRVRTAIEGGIVRIDIEDTGTGIPAGIRDRIFDPFFTTKEVGKGTGQGLTIARSIVVDKHQGSISFDTEPGKGTAFTVRLPVAGDEQKKKEAGA